MTLIEKLRAAYNAAVEARNAADDALNRAVDAATAPEDDADLTGLRTALDLAKVAYDETDVEVTRTKGNLDDAETRQRAREAHPTVASATDVPDVRGIAEPATYRQNGPHSFFADAYAHQFKANPQARERLEKHGRENLAAMRANGNEPMEFRDVGTGAFAGFTIPQFLTDLWAPLARAGAPTVNALRKEQLPNDGMVLSIGRITTGSAAAVQATENSAVQETDIDDTKLDVNVRTIAGAQDVSRQALERSLGVDGIVYGDLVSDYFTKLDDQVLNADGTSGTHLSFRSTSSIIAKSYTDASPTVAEFYSATADAIGQVNAARFAAATTIIMAPRRWAFLTAAGDTAGRPVVLAANAGPQNPIAIGDAAAYGNYVGTLHGLPVITDANLPLTLGASTNEDIMLIIRNPDHILWWEGDGMPRQLRFEETLGGSLTVKLVVYGYSAFTAGRYPKGVATVGGTGMAAPTFA